MSQKPPLPKRQPVPSDDRRIPEPAKPVKAQLMQETLDRLRRI